ncbi:hypothetical protein [Priestia megaterium]|uniref:hypothetical protein n=1 Tax=Priestia megaterium TaxID=1404 RepID=UPI00237C0F11|nr:hypothetical protein [Priestia megaterium]
MQNRILIVEDEEMIARALQIELEHEGYQVFVEHEGKSGLEAALHNSIDLVLFESLGRPLQLLIKSLTTKSLFRKSPLLFQQKRTLNLDLFKNIKI